MRMRAAVVATLAGMALAVPAAPARAAACTQGAGVTLVVDFASLGGGTQTRCAAGDPSTGLAALRGAGFTPTRAAQEPGYFLCRIDGKPANDPCQRTSPADAYWSYWHAKPGGTWSYSSIGPADYDPAPGTVDGWAFGAGRPPSSPPPPARPTAAPSPSPTATAAPLPRSSPRPVTAAPVATAAAPTRSVAPVGSARPTPTPAPAAVTEPSDDPDADADAHASSRIGVALNDDGPGIGLIVGAALLLALVLGAVVTAARRRDRY